jgi:hypothetical protein
MVAPRIAAAVLAISFFAVAPSRAQQPSKPPANAFGTGLLVAFLKYQSAPGVSPSVTQYETLWIVRNAAGVRVAAKLQDIIVPRKAGFWRLGVQHTCQFRSPGKDDPQDHGDIITEHLPYSVPVEEAPDLLLGYPSCDPETLERVFDPAYDPYAISSVGTAPTECVWNSASLDSVLPDLVSISFGEGVRETCDPHNRETFRVSVQTPDSLSSADHGVSISRVFGDAGSRAWNRAIRAAAKEGSCSEVPPPSDGGWYLEHSGGQWHAGALLQWGAYRMDCVLSDVVNLLVPRSVTHAAPLPVSWATLEKQLPGLTDAYISPDGSVLVAILSKEDNSTHRSEIASVQLFDFSAHELGPKLLDLPPNSIVMAEWATGRFVQAWTDSLTALATRGLPVPIFTVRDSSRYRRSFR